MLRSVVGATAANMMLVQCNSDVPISLACSIWFFASVEQQLDPTLRGRPVAITAVDSDSGACVAASYEAKAHGVRTGTHGV